MENAKILEEAKIARVIEEKDLNSEKLVECIMEMLTKRLHREEIRKRTAGIFIPDAAKRLAREIVLLGSSDDRTSV